MDRRQTDGQIGRQAGRQTSRQTDLPAGSAVVPSEGEGEVSTANLAHGDTLVRDHDGSLGSKLPLDRELEVGRGKEKRGEGGKREREKGGNGGGGRRKKEHGGGWIEKGRRKGSGSRGGGEEG